MSTQVNRPVTQREIPVQVNKPITQRKTPEQVNKPYILKRCPSIIELEDNKFKLDIELLKYHFDSKKNEKAKKWFFSHFSEKHKDLAHERYNDYLYKNEVFVDFFWFLERLYPKYQE